MSLEVNYRTNDGRMSAKFTGDVKEVFEHVAKFAEVFETNTVCGNCKSEDVRPSVRVVEDNKYYEKKCNACGYGFSYGQTKKGGTLFPKWQLGWTKYKSPVEEEDVFDEKKATAKKATK